MFYNSSPASSSFKQFEHYNSTLGWPFCCIVFVSVHVHVSLYAAVTCKCKRMSQTLELKLLAAMNCLTWTLRTELGSFRRAVYAFNFSDHLVAFCVGLLFQMRIQPPATSILFYCHHHPIVCLSCLIDYVFDFLVAFIQSYLAIYPSCCVPDLSVNYFGFVREVDNLVLWFCAHWLCLTPPAAFHTL